MKRNKSLLTKWDYFEIITEIICDVLPVYILAFILAQLLQEMMIAHDYTNFSASLGWVSVFMLAGTVLRYMNYIKNIRDKDR